MSQNRASIIQQLSVAFGEDSTAIANDLIGDWNSRMPNTSIFGLKSVSAALIRITEHASKFGTPDLEMAEYWKEASAHYFKFAKTETVAAPIAERKRFTADYVAPVFVAQEQAVVAEVAEVAKPVKAKQPVKRVVKKTVESVDMFA